MNEFYNGLWTSTTPKRLATVGAMAPPPGVTPNFDHPVSRSSHLLAANIACLLIASIFVMLRAYTNIFLVQAVGRDDYVCMLSLLLSIAFSICSMLLCHLGLGVHIWDIPLHTYSPGWLRMNMILTAIYPILIFLVKTSILLLYIRVLGTCKRTRNGAYGLIGFVFVYCFAAFVATVFACRPIHKIWDVRVSHGQCINVKAVVTAVAALNVVSDILILILPMPLVWFFLKVPQRQKIALTAVFMTGSFVCVVSMVRLKEVVAAMHTSDSSWAELDSILWSVVEVNVGIACACMPTLKLLVRKIFPHALEPSRAEAGESKSGSSSTTPKAQDGENVRPANKDFEKGGKTGQEEVDVGSVGGESDTTRSSEPYFSDVSGYITRNG